MRIHIHNNNTQVELDLANLKVTPITNRMTDFEFVLSCVCPNPELCPVDEIRSSIGDGINWEQITHIATLQGIVPLFFYNLKTVADGILPLDFKAQIDKYFQVSESHYLLQTQELGRVTQLFEEHQIPSIILKGLPLSLEAYENVLLRRSTDFDILVPKEHFSEAEQILFQDGYQSSYSQVGFKKQAKVWFGRQYHYNKYDGLFNLDLHTNLMPPGYRYPITFERLRVRSKKQFIDGIEVRTLEPEELLILLSYHGVKNQWRSLKYICDIAALIESHPDLNWDIIYSRVKEYRCERMLLVGLSLSNQLLKTSLPSNIKRLIEKNRAVQRVVQILIDILRQRHLGEQLTYPGRVWFHLSARENPWDKMRYVLYSLLANIWAVVSKGIPTWN